jgi:putative membrane protein
MRNPVRSGSIWLVITLAIVATGNGCGGGQAQTPAKTSSEKATTVTHSAVLTTEPASVSVTDETTPLVETTAPAGGKKVESAKPVTTLNDDEIVTVLIVANQGEVTTAELALKRASSTDVKEFAGMMKMQHGAGAQRAKAVQAKSMLKSAPSDLSTKIDDDVTAMVRELKTKEGDAFDRIYMDAQWKAHKDLLGTMDDRLIPSASKGDVKSLLTEQRRHVADHLAKAEEIRDKLNGASSPPISMKRH